MADLPCRFAPPLLLPQTHCDILFTLAGLPESTLPALVTHAGFSAGFANTTPDIQA
jgi:hypothetical protein